MLYKQYHYCQQVMRTVVEYTDEFQDLRARNNIEENESHEVLRYITSSSEPIRSQVDVRKVANFLEAVTLATKI